MIEPLKNAYEDYKSALITLREHQSHPNFGITIHLDDEESKRYMEVIVPRGELIDMIHTLVYKYRDQLTMAYRAEANNLEGETP